MKTVSLLIRTRNRPALLQEALQSIKEQTYRSLEVVVVNDAGQDVHEQVANVLEGTGIDWQYAEFSTAQGRSAAANRALELARGEFIQFLDDDDWLAPAHVQRLVAQLDAEPALIGAYSDTHCIYRQTPERIERCFAEEYDPLRLATENYLPIHAVLFRRQVVDAGCRFDTELSLYEDWHFWLQVARLGPLKRVPHATAYYALDVSGVGGQQNGEYRAERLLALRKTLPLLTDEQLLHLGFASVALREAQQRVTRLTHEKDAQERQLQLQLQHLQAGKAYLERQVETRLINPQAVRAYRDRLKRKCYTLRQLVMAGDWRGIAERLRRPLGRADFARAPRAGGVPPLEQGVDILCTRHTHFVAQLIADALRVLGDYQVNILDPDTKRFTDRLHIVICPQMFATLPGRYIAFQMEQSVSSRWFDKRYFSVLERSVAVLDYSLKNIKYLQVQGNLAYRQLFHVPISNLDDWHPAPDSQTSPEYDVVFYGDIHNPRRKAFLDAIGQHYNLLVVNEVFGEELYAQLRRARLVINIHYYEGALLETTRIYECLSLGLPVVSERSVDMDEHACLEPWVSFTRIGDVEHMVNVIGERLESLRDGNQPLASLPVDLAHFRFHFARMLMALDLIEPDRIDELPAPVSVDELQSGIGLSLPETFARRQSFKTEFPDVPVFPGLRHVQGWRGAALSFRYLARRALAEGLDSLEIREDDVLLDASAQKRWQQAQQLFASDQSQGRFDLLCGLIADVSDDARVLEVFEHQDQRYVVMDRMTSMVCNRYGKRALELLADWDPADVDIEHNTIDRYLEKQSLRVLIPLPFIAGHQPEQTSTLWNFRNSTYDEMIVKSEAKLQARADACIGEQRQGDSMAR